MRLSGKKLLLLVSDGIDEAEFHLLKSGFEKEQASVLTTAPQGYGSVETVCDGRRGTDIAIDLPLEMVAEVAFSGLIIPDGLLSTQGLLKSPEAVRLVQDFHAKNLPIFTSGNAVQLLYESQILSPQLLIREGTALNVFLDQAVAVLLDSPVRTWGDHFKYRPTM